MSVARPARCLFSMAMAPSASRSASAAPVVAAPLRRRFHASPAHSKRRRPNFPNIKADDMKKLQDMAATQFPTYSPEDKKLLAAKYSPEQLAALEAGEAAIDPVDLLVQAKPRYNDTMYIPYKDDFAGINYLADLQPKKERDPKVDYNMRPKTDDEMVDAIRDFWEKEQARVKALNLIRYLEFMNNPRTFMHANSEEAYEAMTDPGFDLTAPELPKLPELQDTTKEAEEDDPAMKRFMRQTGYRRSDLRNFRTKVLVVRRVVNQTRLGKIRSYYYLAIAGNKNGLLGIGEGKSTEPAEGRTSSIYKAIRNAKPVPRYEERTIFGEIKGKVGAVELKLSARPPGFGLRCQHLIFEIARICGIKDLSANVERSRNKMNVVKATVEALLSQRLPEDVARARGIKLVDARKVYYGGKVL
ncbi:hypothetical protein K490DRAFT_38283 [Saccharata proteae CBS 121410]|uniref:Small ribosomal subunit protein uS5m n=1 Tax=Saccharata proteae CBS 121410 TaxID=1314787 RepID=A0A6A5YBJ5_9PEZI|nr:hypothetical protein K490DRAFT_38283 [Saccharata proteae CBS 121410]